MERVDQRLKNLITARQKLRDMRKESGFSLRDMSEKVGLILAMLAARS